MWTPNFILVATEAAMMIGGFLWASEEGPGMLSVTNRVILGVPAHGANHLWLKRVAEPGERSRQL